TDAALGLRNPVVKVRLLHGVLRSSKFQSFRFQVEDKNSSSSTWNLELWNLELTKCAAKHRASLAGEVREQEFVRVGRFGIRQRDHDEVRALAGFEASNFVGPAESF